MTTRFVTRRSTMGWAITVVVAAVVIDLAADNGHLPASGTYAAVTAAAMAVASVAVIVCWFNSIVLAVRARSGFWIAVAVLMFPPFNGVLIPMYCPAEPAPGEPRDGAA